MTTITRQQLRDAIEVGIKAAESSDRFTSQAAGRLRVIGNQAMMVARGSYEVHLADGAKCRCPVSQAYPRHWRRLAWGSRFTSAYDRATGNLGVLGGGVLCVSDDNTTEGEA